MYYAATKIKYRSTDLEKMCGDGHIEKLEHAPNSLPFRALYVEFVDGAHTKWHYHEGEQILVGMKGKGFVQFEGLEKQELHVMDRVFIPTGTWHRHGAKEGETLVHLAITIGETIWETNDPCR